MPFLPAFDSDNFTPGERIDNRFFPLNPGTIQTFFGSVEDPDTGEEHTEGNDFFVTRLTTSINGIQVIVVRDTAYDDGVLVEDTIDWFAQDQAGNVWYLGEIVNNYVYNEHNGNFVETNHDGAWQAGVDGALPGWIMEAVSRIGDNYFQEFSPGIAVDEALVTRRNLTITADDVTYTRVLQIRERSELEPDVFGFKYYAPGIGVVRVEEFDANGDLEFVSELIGTRNLARTDQRGLETPEQEDFALTGQRVYLQLSAADTDAVNALGAYTFDLETGEIGEAWIVLAEIDPEDLGSICLNLEAGQGLGLFLVPNADEVGLNLSKFEDGGLFFVNMLTGEAATLGDGMAPMIVDEDGQPLPLQAFHALGSGNGFNLLNPGAGINAIEGEWRGRGGDDVEVIRFEDTRVTDPEFDGDFDDLIIVISEQAPRGVCGVTGKGGPFVDSVEQGAWQSAEPANYPSQWTQAEWDQTSAMLIVADTGLWA